jgi:ribonuclease P protein component
MGETTVPAQQPAAGQASRLSAPHVDAGGTGDRSRPTAQGSHPAVGLIWRVRDRATFEEFRRGTRVRRGPLTVTYVAGPIEPSSGGRATNPPRAAYTVGRAVGPAVVRNRLRRRLRAALTTLRPRLAAGGAYLISAGPTAVTLSFLELQTTLEGALVAVADRGERGQ